MTKIWAKHLPYTNGHLGKVYNEMQLTGPPTIRVVQDSIGDLVAVEGSHRICAAHDMGLPLKVILLKPDCEGADEFFDRVKPTLPTYEFDTILCLDERAFDRGSEINEEFK